jgi:hypothetical protein
MALNIDGVTIPDTQLAREITELVRDTESALLFHHSSRITSAHWLESNATCYSILSCSTRARCSTTWA